jgi:hypothetical protein
MSPWPPQVGPPCPSHYQVAPQGAWGLRCPYPRAHWAKHLSRSAECSRVQAQAVSDEVCPQPLSIPNSCTLLFEPTAPPSREPEISLCPLPVHHSCQHSTPRTAPTAHPSGSGWCGCCVCGCVDHVCVSIQLLPAAASTAANAAAALLLPSRRLVGLPARFTTWGNLCCCPLPVHHSCLHSRPPVPSSLRRWVVWV